ncbi:hypothetical protein [Riemerella anatipestifer]|uniref:Uncharacterized protein n=2 Tax=Riemerella anatipestifer TaxID=34085 RepID=J9QTG4_RIEAN|nr:hypothetical protein [Riemerella anatipestifer]AFR35876.1 hypothetical protein B739_1278 [Riemerella anatipestifer RA-CH-1]MCU7581613.1 hypothetical protein [Riemerella anatipestifer]MDD1550111.1 hypothetical protein [Riemerella anatipestifer]MSN87450.1 hypothetical protein [Riemerella anatipestifer]MSN91612.1 hypothetical protein [Riemerella anatipestifer]
MAFRLNATKPNKNAGLPTPKSELYLLYVEDIISMPTANPKGVITEGNIVIADGRRFHVLYLTPSTQTHNRDTEGDVDSRGWKKKITGHYPGDEIEINEFVKNNTNQGFVIVSKTCNSEYKRIYGSKCNPLYFTGAYVDDSEKKGYELTFEQEFADNDPVLFYNGNILVDEDALNPNDPEFSSLFVKIDGSNINSTNKEKLKKALDVGELPTNIATIGENGKVGTTYTKEQTDASFIKKPTSTITQPNTSFKYALLLDEQGNSTKMLAGDLGKNMSNSQLMTLAGAGITQCANYTWNTAGYYLYFKGLPNKYADAKFDKKVVIDSNGQVAISEREDITINIPETFNGSASLGSITIGVNHIYPQAIPNRPSFADEIQQIMANYKNINFTLISRGQWILWTKGNKGLSANSIDSDGFFSLDGYNSDFKDYDSTNLVVDLYSDVSLPSDRNWILKITGFLETGYGGGNIYFGVSRSGDSNIAFGIEPTSYARLKAMGDTQGEYVLRNNFLCIILKVGGVIFTSIYGGGRNNFNTSNAYTELGNYTPRVTINKNQGKISGKMSYKILD